MVVHPVIIRDRNILGGTPVFTGTRVPVQTLRDYFKAGYPIDTFLDDYPSVQYDQAIALLDVLCQVVDSGA